MTSSAVLGEIEPGKVLWGAGVVVLAILSWLILALLASLVLKKRGRALLNPLRFIFFPALIYYLTMRLYFPVDDTKVGDTTALKIAKTALAAAGVFLGMGILNLVFTPSAFRRWLGRDVPGLFLDVARYLIIVLAVAVILKSVWQEDVTPLIGALGIGGIVLGLALQETLSNFFSGLAILAERPFSIGDWIKVGDGREGQVEHVTWRAVKIRTSDNEYIIYPNSQVAREKVVNFNLPTRVQARRLSIGTSYDDPPDLVKRTIREVLADVPGILADPPPAIYTVAYADFSINYEVKFFIEDFGSYRTIEDQVMSRLWYAFRRRGVEIPFPIRHLYHHGLPPPLAGEAAAGAVAAPPADARKEAAIRGALSAVPIFAELSEAERESLARGAMLADYGSGERVIRQGDPGEALYALAAGRARVAVRGEDGGERDVASLKEGDVFGEMSLLTGEPRSASVYSQGELRVVEVRKSALAPILSANPGLAARIAEVVVLRREGLDRARAQAALEGKRGEVNAAARALLGRIRTFFGLGG
jgi:small-conductance mechanosensitive channel/CRP-like cAMP-binding protein